MATVVEKLHPFAAQRKILEQGDVRLDQSRTRHSVASCVAIVEWYRHRERSYREAAHQVPRTTIGHGWSDEIGPRSTRPACVGGIAPD